ncbi:MAG: hypothetical protein ACYC39_09475 [Thiobacillus sp.]|nr:MAG: hypothetical protein B7X82_14555 [Hydrogenophilales bacterium 17-64-65]
MKLKHAIIAGADAFDRFTAWIFCLRADPTLSSIPLRILVAAALGITIGVGVSIVRYVNAAMAPPHTLNALYLSQPGREAELGEILNRCERGDETPQQCESAQLAIGRGF